MQLDPLEMLDGNVYTTPVPRRRKRQGVLLLVPLSVDLERLLAPWRVHDLARGLDASCAGPARNGGL
jgi:hypothetical protein